MVFINEHHHSLSIELQTELSNLLNNHCISYVTDMFQPQLYVWTFILSILVGNLLKEAPNHKKGSRQATAGCRQEAPHFKRTFTTSLPVDLRKANELHA